jgi:hypothetical protein
VTLNLSHRYGFNAKRGGNDPYWSSVVFMMNCQGADESVPAVDESQYQHPLFLYNACKLDTAQAYVGGSALRVEGTNDASVDFMAVADHAAFTIATNDATWEAAVRSSITGTSRQICGQTTAAAINAETAWGFSLSATGKFQFTACQDVNSMTLVSTTTQAANNWYDLAVVKSGNNYSLYVNENREDTDTLVGAVNNSAGGLAFGRTGDYLGDGWPAGWFGRMRITNGVARYSGATRVVPVGLFPVG